MTDSDCLQPWGAAGPPAPGRWVRDVLGDGFECRSFQLPDDDEGEVFTTLVRHLPQSYPEMKEFPPPLSPVSAPCAQPFALLYLHGRNDYFFQTEMARQISACGGQFYALDLRKYGRSLRPWQTIGYIDDLRTYDEDIAAATGAIRQDHPELPLFLMGHSTGGLVATLWAWNHQDECAGLILNSAWLELQALAPARPALQAMIGKLADRRPHATVAKSESDHYWRSLKKGWNGSGFDVPSHLKDAQDDPALSGWQFFDQWKRPESYPAPAAWLEAIMAAQQQVEQEVRLRCPVLSLAAKNSTLHGQWNPAVFDTDIVLDADAIQQRAAQISSCVTLVRLRGRHDLSLSDPDVRQRFYGVIARWLTQATTPL